MVSCPWKMFFPLVRIVVIFRIAGLLFFVLRARRTLGAYRIPRETGLLIPSEKQRSRLYGIDRGSWQFKWTPTALPRVDVSMQVLQQTARIVKNQKSDFQ